MRRPFDLSPVTPRVPIPANNLVTAIGDSITSASGASTGGTVPIATLAAGGYGRYQAQLSTVAGVGAYFTWAAMLPKTGDTVALGRMRWAGVHATVNMRADQVRTTHLDGVDSPLNDLVKPGTCVVMAGSNNLPLISPSGSVIQDQLDLALTDLKYMYTKLMANGILPIACQIPPSDTANYGAGVLALNDRIVKLAAAMHIPCVDMFTPAWSGTGATWGSGNTNDGIHPSVTGAKLMAQPLTDMLHTVLPNSYPVLAVVATDDASNMLYRNGSFTDDGNADGVPDGGGPTQSATYWTQTANGCVWTLGTRTGFDGKALRFNKTTDPGTSELQGSGSAPPAPLEVDGHIIGFGFVMEIASWNANTFFQVSQWKVLDSTVRPFNVNIRTDGGFTSAIAPFVWYQEFAQLSGY